MTLRKDIFIDPGDKPEKRLAGHEINPEQIQSINFHQGTCGMY